MAATRALRPLVTRPGAETAGRPVAALRGPVGGTPGLLRGSSVGALVRRFEASGAQEGGGRLKCSRCSLSSCRPAARHDNVGYR